MLRSFILFLLEHRAVFGSRFFSSRAPVLLLRLWRSKEGAVQWNWKKAKAMGHSEPRERKNSKGDPRSAQEEAIYFAHLRRSGSQKALREPLPRRETGWSC